MNHYEEIKNMSLEEMAVRLSQIAACAHSMSNDNLNLKAAVDAGVPQWSEYLKAEVAKETE